MLKLIRSTVFYKPLVQKVDLADLPDRLKFDLRLQASLRRSAINIMAFYEEKGEFQEYISEREEKIRILLNVQENPQIFENGNQIFP